MPKSAGSLKDGDASTYIFWTLGIDAIHQTQTRRDILAIQVPAVHSWACSSLPLGGGDRLDIWLTAHRIATKSHGRHKAQASGEQSTTAIARR